jgi:hypothetical protein
MLGVITVSGAVVALVTANEEGECESNRSLNEMNGETANCCQEPVGSEPLSCLTTKQRWVKATCSLQDAGNKSVFFGDQAFVYFTGNTSVCLGFIVDSSVLYSWLVIKTRYLTMCSAKGPLRHVNGLCVLHTVEKLDIY